MSADMSAVSNEASLVSSIANLLPTTVSRVLFAVPFVLTLVLYLTPSLSKTTQNLHNIMASTEHVFFSSVEAGLFSETSDSALYADLARLQLTSSELREQSLRASLSTWSYTRATCTGLAFRIRGSVDSATTLKTRIEVVCY
ncbi:hypothetical protein FB45DRAFT_1030780 [Roridomyces roridus]|uniref:Uncharacterized protein n=1 Tax=Roridomyces roridus TaxID=1738132 RepID=A0AAD7BLU4_9AGAR|nr:hypothetical protein FB45DRAFT_1030780 [Roridomyces roridus]